MALRARLTTLRLGEFQFDPTQNIPNQIPAILVRVSFFVPLLVTPNASSGPIVSTGVLATGEPFSVFPRSAWELFEPGNEPHGDRIEWLRPLHAFEPPTATHPQPAYPGPHTWVFRDRYRFQFGRIWATVFDDEGRQLRAVPMVARFLLDSSPDIPEPLIGLQASVLSNRRLIREPIWDEAAQRFRQEWWLEDPA